MSLLIGFLLLIISIIPIPPFPVFTNLTRPRMPEYSKWCYITLNDNIKLKNFTIPIPNYALAVQLTSNNGNNDGGYFAKISNYSIINSSVSGKFSNKVLNFSVMWWGKPWKLYIGWKGPIIQIPEKPCSVVTEL